MLLLTTLLPAQTNESHRTTDGQQAADNRNILTSHKPVLANNEININANVTNPVLNKKNESIRLLLSKQMNWLNNFNLNKSESNVGEKLENIKNGSYLHSGRNNNYRRETSKQKTETILGTINKFERKDGEDKDFKNRTLPGIGKKIENTTRNSESKNSSLTLDKNEEKGANTNPRGKTLGIGYKLGSIEEIYVFEEEEGDEVVVEIIDEDAIDGKSSVTHIYLEEQTLDDAVRFGMQTTDDLIKVKEPMWHQMGLFLDWNDPASKVAAFGAPNKIALELSKFGFLTLEASKKIAESFPENVSRQATGFPGSFHPRLLQDDCPLKGVPRCPPASKRYRTADGSCNNLKDPWKGSAMLPMQRFLPPAYEDGIQSIRRSVFGSRLPSARDISVRIHRDRNHEIPTVTLMFMQWGQFIDHDITSVVKSRSFNGSIPRCCDRGGREMLPPEFTHPSCLPIEVSDDDWFLSQFGIKCMEFIRSAPSTRINCDLGWREQINQVTPYIDASTIYGSDIETSDSIRTFRNGKILYGRSHIQRPLQPPDPPGGELCRSGALTDDCFSTGDGRVSEQPGLTAFHTVWVRFHNKVATVLSKFNPHWSDEKVFQETRKIVYSLIQHITYREFLPIVLGPEVMRLFELNLERKEYYSRYDSRVNPAIANSFSAAAYRFGHSMVQNSYVRTDHKHRPLFNNVTLHEELDNIENIWSFGSLDRLLLGFANQPSQRRDEFICDELSNHLFQSPNAFFGLDLAAINIQRGRDHGIPSYTSWRQPCGLSTITNWKDLERIFNVGSVQRFQSLYRHVDDIDLFSGGLAEKPVRGGVVGPTFACILAQQFLNLRKGDRFWYENGGFESSFTPAQLQQIRHATFAYVLCQTTDEIETIQPFVFLSSDDLRNARLPCNSPIINNFDLSAWIEREFNDIDNKIDFAFKREGVDELQEKRSSSLSRKLNRQKRKTTTARSRTTTKAKPRRKKITTEAPVKKKNINVTSGSIKLENKYVGNNVVVNSIPARPIFTEYRPETYLTNDQTDVTYLVGFVPTMTTPLPPKRAEKPLEVNIKIQYFLPTIPTTDEITSVTKKKKRPITRPTSSYEQDDTILITQRPLTNKPQTDYPVDYDHIAVQSYKPTDRPRPIYSDNKRPTYTHNRPINDDDDTYEDFRPTSNNKPYNNNKRPTYTYNGPTNNDDDMYEDFKPNNNKPGDTYSNLRPAIVDGYSKPTSYNTDIYSYGGPTTKRPYIIRPSTNYDNTDPIIEDVETIFEDQPFSTSQRPTYRPESNYIYSNAYPTSRPNFRPQQNSYNDETVNNIYNNNKRPIVQDNYNRGDPIHEVYSQLLNDHDRVGDIPKKPTFGQTDFYAHDRIGDVPKKPSFGQPNFSRPVNKPSVGLVNKVNKPTTIYTTSYVHKLDSSELDDKLDFKTKFISKHRHADETKIDDRRFVKISSVKGAALITDRNAEFYSVQKREGDMDLNADDEEKEIQVVDIDVAPSEVENDHWLFYNATEEIMPLLPVPDINLNISCSNELPKPMNATKVSHTPVHEDSRRL